MNQKIGLYAAVAVLLAAFVWTSYQVKRSEMTGAAAGKWSVGASPGARTTAEKAPGFALTSLDGRRTSLAEFEGKNIVLLDFSDTSSAPCRAATARLVGLDAKYGNKGLKIVSIFRGEDRVRVSQFVKEFAYKPLVLLDDGPTSEKYHVRTLPTLVLVDKAGSVSYAHEGYDAATHIPLEMTICKLLGLKYTPEPGMGGRRRYGRH